LAGAVPLDGVIENHGPPDVLENEEVNERFPLPPTRNVCAPGPAVPTCPVKLRDAGVTSKLASFETT
jgi:hypothetical protein